MKQVVLLFAVACLSLVHLYINRPARADESPNRDSAAFASQNFSPKSFKKDDRSLKQKPALEFEGVEFSPETFLVDDLFRIIEFKRVRQNVSMGVTNSGLKLGINW